MHVDIVHLLKFTAIIVETVQWLRVRQNHLNLHIVKHVIHVPHALMYSQSLKIRKLSIEFLN